MTDDSRLWNRRFLLTAVGQFLNYSNNLMLGPVLPLYLVSIGQTPAFIGVTLAAFSVASFLPRPLVGQAVDRWSPRGVAVLGSLGLAGASASYLIPAVGPLLAGRAVHGLGWAAINTAGVTIASEVTPEQQRGAAVGYLGTAQNVARTIMPAAGIALVAVTGYASIFILSALLGVAAAIAALVVRTRPREKREPGERSSLVSSLVEPRALMPSGIFALHSVGASILNSLVALYALDRGIGELSLFFILAGVASIGGTLLSPLSDRWGRWPIAVGGFVVSILGLGLMGIAGEIVVLTIGGALWGIGQTVVQPALLALTMDRTPAARRGAAVATFTAAFQIGNGGGGLLWGFVIQYLGFGAMFAGAIALTLAGLAWLGTVRQQR